MLDGPIDGSARKRFVDAMGAANDRYRAAVYRGYSGRKQPLERRELRAFVGLALEHLDHSIALARRADGLFHAYNLIRIDADGYEVEPLDEMLEGQVAVIGSGCLDGEAVLGLLESLRSSRLYREDQNSYLLYPDRTLPSFLDKNIIPPALAGQGSFAARELEAGRTDYVERDRDGRLHFNGVFRNACELRAALERDPAVGVEDADDLCSVYEEVFEHRRFTGRSGSMYKYEGLGCIYWHMVSKLLLATGEAITRAVEDGAEAALVQRLSARFREIRDGLGMHKDPADYGAFPLDPYSHTPGFTGVQQPGLTGQVKEDLITRHAQLGVRVDRGEIAFEPTLLGRDEFLQQPTSWSYSVGGPARTEELPAGTLAFTLCGVPVVYRLADSARLHVIGEDGNTTVIEGSRLGAESSRSLFRRDGRIARLVVDLEVTG